MTKQLRSTSDVLDHSWSRISSSRIINATPDQIWTKVSDPNQWLNWYRPLSEFSVLDDSDLVLGATIAERQGPWKSTAEVTEWDIGRTVGLALRTFNYRALLSQHYRRIELTPGAKILADAQQTTVTFSSGFAFGWVGWLMFPYSYPHMLADMYFEQRSVLKGLAAVFADNPANGRQDS